MEEKHVVSVIRFILLWVSCVGEPPVPASKEWLETHQGEAAGSLGARLQLWAWGAPEEALLWVRLLVLPNKRGRAESPTSPFEEVGLCPKTTAGVSTEDASQLMYF